MRLKYKFFDKEDRVGRFVVYDYPSPFHKNMDEDFKMQYGEELYFIKELNHKDRIIRLHSAYDSGKGTIYIPPVISRRKRLDLIIKEIFNLSLKARLINITTEDDTIILIFYKGRDYVEIFREATYRSGSVTGYKTTIHNSSLLAYFKLNKIYPLTYKEITDDTERI